MEMLQLKYDLDSKVCHLLMFGAVLSSTYLYFEWKKFVKIQVSHCRMRKKKCLCVENAKNNHFFF